MLKGKSLGVTDETKKLPKAKYVEHDEEEEHVIAHKH